VYEGILEVSNLRVHFRTDEGTVPAVNGVDFSVAPGEILGLVGESGCGKSVTSLAIMRLVPKPAGKIVSGEIVFEGENLLAKAEADMRKIRGNDISMIFQEPMTSLNPVLTVGEQLMETIVLHQGVGRREARVRASDMLAKVGIPSPERRIGEYPHQMSGGMRQRVMIAMALSCRPKLLIADEPTTALDVTTQAQILSLMSELQTQFNTATILITHDLGVIAEMADRVVVMYAGKVVETADLQELFDNPAHPYTLGLLGSVPRLDQNRRRLDAIEGTVPNMINMPRGCEFSPRCRFSEARCREDEPELVSVGPRHMLRCFRGRCNRG
jgi:oligopeptide/dipeptide ABC transporter ATP-binding protein